MSRREEFREQLDYWERRAIPALGFEVRSDSNELVLRGYASTFQPYEMYGGPTNGDGWIEQLDRRAFDETLRDKPDVMLLINHDGAPLARTKSGTLKLSVDNQGLLSEARLDRSNPRVQELESAMRRGDMDEMSFAFRVKGQKWEAAPGFENDQYSLRKITAVNLHKGDVSVVNFGANPTTHAEMKSVSDALEFLANADRGELVEVRADSDLLKRAQDTLEALKGEPEAKKPAGGMSLRDALAMQGHIVAPGSTLSLNEAQKFH